MAHPAGRSEEEISSTDRIYTAVSLASLAELYLEPDSWSKTSGRHINLL